MLDDFAYRTICETAALIRNRKLSPVELTLAILRRIEAKNDWLHAFITITSKTAIEDAYRAELEIQRGDYRGPLHGIPIAHKDIVATKGIRTTAHSRLLKDWIPTENATVFERLQSAGAICLGKTSLHEFAFGSPDSDEAFSAARNPWNVDYAPGSSSSGSAAAVAAGLCMGATGTDTGGSIRFPASVCGIVGMKPTFGTISAYGVIPLARSLDHVGPMTRTVRDNAVMLRAMTGYDPKDPTSIEYDVPDFEALIGKSVRGLTLGVPRRFIESIPHDKEMLTAFDHAEYVFKGLGADIRDIEIPGLSNANDDAGLIIAWEAYQYHKENLDAQPDKFGSTFRTRIGKAAQHTQADYKAALQQGKRLRAAYDAVFTTGISVIISPGCEGSAFSMADLLANPTKRSLAYRMYNLSGMPALTLPMGFGRNGLPLGLQLAARRFDEPLIYQIAEAFESVTKFFECRPIEESRIGHFE